MESPSRFEAPEARALAEDLRAGRALACPRCGVPLDRWPVPPRADVSYVRDRLWLVCPSCRRTVILDRKDP